MFFIWNSPYIQHLKVGYRIFHNLSTNNCFQPFPPPYHVRDVEVPTGLFVGKDDWLATPEDIGKHIKGVMRDEFIVKESYIDRWNHMDFVWGTVANEKVYKDVIQLVNKYKPEK